MTKPRKPQFRLSTSVNSQRFCVAGEPSTELYDVMIERIPDSQAIAYEGMPHNICDAAPDRCVEDVLAFLRWRFGEPR